MESLVGRTLQNGKYLLEQELGQGGFGITYKATDLIKKESVVIKTLKKNKANSSARNKLRKQFLDEARRLVKCEHKNIVRYRYFFEENEQPFIVMDYIPGSTLDDIVIPDNPLPEAIAIEYIQQVGEALKVVHRNGLLHRDIKPQNLILHSQTKQVMLIDFGIAREFSQQGKTLTHTNLISEGYAPLEQYLPKARRTAATDVYGLAATLYTLLTAQIPTASTLRGRIPLSSPRDLRPDVSETVSDAVMAGIAVEPGDRPATIDEWLNLLSSAKNAPQVARIPQRSSDRSTANNKVRLQNHLPVTAKKELFYTALPKKKLPILPKIILLSIASLLGINYIWPEIETEILSQDSENSVNSITSRKWEVAGSGDFDGDNNSDIFWRDYESGNNKIWLMEGAKITKVISLESEEDLEWEAIGTGDFNDDDYPDILWRNYTTANNKIWFMKEMEKSEEISLQTAEDLKWRMIGAGDFNGDNNTDIFWSHSATGENAFWLMNGTIPIKYVLIQSTEDLNWKPLGVGDFNDDNMTDIFWFNSSTRENAIWLMNGTEILGYAKINFSSDINESEIPSTEIWQIIGIGDFNGDNEIDTLWQNDITKQTKIWFADDTKLTEGVPITARVDRDRGWILPSLLLVIVILVILSL